MNLLQFLPRCLPGVTASARALTQRTPPPPPPRLLPFRQRRSGVMRALRPASLLLAAVALLALFGALALPTTAQAQSAGVLVSNMGQTSRDAGTSITSTWLAAQSFSVPSSGGNYTLTSIEILVGADIAATDLGSMTVSVWSADSSGHPDSSLHTLTNPASVTDEVAASFTAPASATLEAGKHLCSHGGSRPIG